AHSRAGLRRRGSFRLLVSLEYLDRDAVGVIDGDKVRADESGSSPEHWDELLVERALRLGLIVDVHMDNGGMHDGPLSCSWPASGYLVQSYCSDRWYSEPNGWTCQAALPVAPAGASSPAHAHPDPGRRSSALRPAGLRAHH